MAHSLTQTWKNCFFFRKSGKKKYVFFFSQEKFTGHFGSLTRLFKNISIPFFLFFPLIQFFFLIRFTYKNPISFTDRSLFSRALSAELPKYMNMYAQFPLQNSFRVISKKMYMLFFFFRDQFFFLFFFSCFFFSWKS